MVRAPIHRFVEPGFRPEVEWIRVPRRDEYLADPFGIIHDGRVSVLCERYDRRTLKGTLVSFDWPARGVRPDPEAVFSLESHASYPFLIEHEGHVYCVPETSRANEVALYEAATDPHRWTKVTTLVQGFPGVDSAVFRFDGRWWLASTHAEAPDRQLSLWYAEDLQGPWQPHPKNPVKDDLTSARSAGTPFVWQGTLYRPAQDCSRTYGGRVAMNAVGQLSPDAFEEHVLTFVEPDPKGPYHRGLHTLSSVGDMTLIDGFRNVFSRAAFRQRLAKGFAGRRARGS